MGTKLSSEDLQTRGRCFMEYRRGIRALKVAARGSLGLCRPGVYRGGAQANTNNSLFQRRGKSIQEACLPRLMLCKLDD